MTNSNRQQSLDTEVDAYLEEGSHVSDGEVEKKLAQLLKQDLFREKTKQIIAEYIDTVPFMKKVQEYADKQIDDRLFRNVKVVGGLILGWIVTIVITYLIAKYAK